MIIWKLFTYENNEEDKVNWGYGMCFQPPKRRKPC